MADFSAAAPSHTSAAPESSDPLHLLSPPTASVDSTFVSNPRLSSVFHFIWSVANLHSSLEHGLSHVLNLLHSLSLSFGVFHCLLNQHPSLSLLRLSPFVEETPLLALDLPIPALQCWGAPALAWDNIIIRLTISTSLLSVYLPITSISRLLIPALLTANFSIFLLFLSILHMLPVVSSWYPLLLFVSLPISSVLRINRPF